MLQALFFAWVDWVILEVLLLLMKWQNKWERWVLAFFNLLILYVWRVVSLGGCCCWVVRERNELGNLQTCFYLLVLACFAIGWNKLQLRVWRKRGLVRKMIEWNLYWFDHYAMVEFNVLIVQVFVKK
jgi:hypothetical protein